MLRFNNRELAYLAHQPTHKFEKEGLLQIKEKQEGLFRKGEVYTERLFRLRGNLLFYFKTKDPHSEPIGVFVMERCVVELDPNEELDYSFVLAFEGEEKSVQLAARSEPERDSWIAALHIASYECLKMQLDSLREQLRARTGKDPIDNPNPSQLQDDRPEAESGDEPFFEMCLRCEGLASESQSRLPNAFISISYQSPPQQQWVTYGHTDIIERSNNPSFLTTIGFNNPVKVNMNTKVRFIVYDVKERMTSTMTQIGVAILALRDLMAAPGHKMFLQLQSTDFEEPGKIHVSAWFNFLPEELNKHDNNTGDPSYGNLQPLSSVTQDKARRLDMLRPLFTNINMKTYRFPTNLGGELIVHEYMAESKLTYLMPRQLLKIWIEEEKEKIQHLVDLGKLGEPWENTRQELMDFHMSTVSMYKQSAGFLASYQGAPFKPSCKKGHKEIEFAPVNLHLQRLWVHNNAANTSGCYDVITVGAFTAYPQKYKHGGLRRMLKQVADGSMGDGGQDRVDKVNEILNSMTTLRLAIHQYCEALCRSAIQGDSAELNNSMSALTDKTHQLIQVCDQPIIDQGVKYYEEAKEESHSDDSSGHLRAPSGNKKEPSPEKTWKWSGTDFIKSPTEEPWELTRLNTEAALMCVISKVEELMKGKDDAGDIEIQQTKWLEEISPPVIRFKSCVEMTSKRAEASLTMLTIQACSNNIQLMHTIKYRRDVVFAQALTSATSGFITKLRCSIGDEKFLTQIFQFGVLMEFESLLSCHSDELGMLEDYAVAVQDLSHVAFKVEKAKNADDILPSVNGSSIFRDGMFPDFNRTGYVVHVPVVETTFQLLPKEIQRGHVIRIVPVLFSIGINEQASFAERFGDTSLQEQVNLESFKKLSSYAEKYLDIIGEPENNSARNSMMMDQLIRHLSMNVLAKKSKNVEVLHLAAEVCRKLNGIRFVSCKSGKDRTSMSVTLEQAQNLLREHDLASHAFSQALDCMRSEGVRRENTLKNAGARKYAFNSLQLKALPKLYRPPSGTYGNVQS